MKTYRWENRFLAFVFGIAEANAFSCFKIWGTFGGSDLLHSDFKSRLSFSLLEKVNKMKNDHEVIQPLRSRISTRSQIVSSVHKHVSLSQDTKRIRKVCRSCPQITGVKRQKVGFRCACNLDAMCKKCHQQHLSEEYAKSTKL